MALQFVSRKNAELSANVFGSHNNISDQMQKKNVIAKLMDKFIAGIAHVNRVHSLLLKAEHKQL